jgi:hypothetical protein
MIVVTGPRIEPRTLPVHYGLELHGYLPDLYRQVAACDLAIVQGGTHHGDGAHRQPPALPRLPAQAPRRAEPRRPSPPPAPSRETDRTEIAAAIAQEIGRPVDYRPGPRRRSSPGSAPVHGPWLHFSARVGDRRFRAGSYPQRPAAPDPSSGAPRTDTGKDSSSGAPERGPLGSRQCAQPVPSARRSRSRSQL